jgi:hypothetical protein
MYADITPRRQLLHAIFIMPLFSLIDIPPHYFSMPPLPCLSRH